MLHYFKWKVALAALFIFMSALALAVPTGDPQTYNVEGTVIKVAGRPMPEELWWNGIGRQDFMPC